MVAASMVNQSEDPFAELCGLKDENETEVSDKLNAPTTPASTQLWVPPIPKEHVDGPFECPFCHMTISVGTGEDWGYV